MNCKLRILLLCVGLLTLTELYPNESLFAQLDALVENRQNSYALYQQELYNLTAELNDIDDTYQQFTLVKQLTELYSTFQYDSTSHYSRWQLRLARQLSDSLFIDAQLTQVHLFSVAGLYSEAEHLLQQIQAGYDLQTNYPALYLKMLCLTNDLFLYKAEFSEYTYSRQYITTAMLARENILQLAPADSYDYIFTKATYEYELGNKQQAILLLENVLDNFTVGQRQYSIIAGTLGYFYQYADNSDKQYYYLTLSAISDLKANIRENNSLRVLATKLYQD